MKKIFCVLMATIILVSSISVSAFALSVNESNAQLNDAYNAMFETVAGDVNKDGKFDALDAREALLASVGKAGDINTSAADMDGDGVVTSVDARTLLRFSAKLDPLDLLYSAADKFNLFNAFANHIKATNQRFQYTSMLQNIDISNNNPNLIAKFNKQMNSIPGMKDEDKIDLGAELTKEKGKITYKCSTRSYAATDLNFPVKNKDFVSKLSLNDVTSITYGTNKTYNYAPKRTADGRVQEQPDYNLTMTGLDVLTVTFAPEVLKTIPSDTTTLRHGKIFDVPQKDTLTSGYDEINKMFTGDLEELIGTMKASFKNLNFHDSSVSIYFNRATKKVCAVEYNLYYDFTVNLAMDLNFKLGLISIINIKDNMDIVDKELSRFAYVFPENYKA